MQCRLAFQGDRCLFCRIWWLYMALPMWALTFPGLGLLLQGSPFLVPGLLLWIPYASLTGHSSESSSADMPLSSLRLGCELCLADPDSSVADCSCCLRHDCLFSSWLTQFLLEWRLQYQMSVEMGFLLWGFLLLSYTPIRHLGALLAIAPLPP